MQQKSPNLRCFVFLQPTVLKTSKQASKQANKQTNKQTNNKVFHTSLPSCWDVFCCWGVGLPMVPMLLVDLLTFWLVLLPNPGLAAFCRKLNSSPLKGYRPNRKVVFLSHHFSGSMLNFGGVYRVCIYNIYIYTYILSNINIFRNPAITSWGR